MTPYKLSSKVLKPTFKVLSKTWLNSKASKQHPNYPRQDWDKHPSYRLHVKLSHSVDQTYIVSYIDDGHEKGTVQHLLTQQVTGALGRGKDDVVHMDPDTPFKTVQTAEFCKRLYEVVKVKGITVFSEVIVDVMKYFRDLCCGSKVDDHLFLSIEFCIEEVYVCFEDVADNL